MSVEHVRSLIRPLIRDNKKLNILIVGITHERYESTLCQTGHNFYVLTDKKSKEWDTTYSKVPDNYYVLDYVPDYIDYDLILCHATDNRIGIAYNLAGIFNIPLIRHTHTVPTSTVEIQAHKEYSKYVTVDSFISEYSRMAWGYPNGIVINHGLDHTFWCKNLNLTREHKALSVVNLWKDRDWACGWNLWNNDIRPFIKTTVAGDNSGLSESKNPEELRKLYNKHLVFINTSLNSPIPMSVLEAMAGGCCVISLPTCMIPEVIKNGINGILCENTKEIVDATNYFFNNPEKAIKIGYQARETISTEYNLDKFVKTWNNHFIGVLNK